jgi:predicted ATPase
VPTPSDPSPGRPANEEAAADRYRAQEAAYAAERDREAARSRFVSNARLAVFLAGLGIAVFTLGGRSATHVAAWAAVGSAGLAFIGLVVVHARIEDRRTWKAALADVNRLGRARIERSWDALPPPETPGVGVDHPYANDLDLFGHASLLQLLETGTPAGRAQLVSWMLAPAPPPVVVRRQAAVAALVPDVSFRQALAAHGRVGAGEKPGDLGGFLAWADSPAVFVQRRWLVWMVRALTAAIWTGIAAQVAGVGSAAVWLTPVLLGGVLSFACARSTQAVFDRAFGAGRVFGRYARLFALVCGLEADAALLVECRARLCAEGSAADQMRRLDRLMALADVRYAMALMHAIIQGLTLWDFHVLFALERWQQSAGRHARRWLDALGTVDALASLATLAHDHPSWARPVMADPTAGLAIRATALAHPLLSWRVRVANDVEVGPPGTVLLVTGSNMSGKSTLLRAVGLNAVLAQAGGPVCASSMILPPVEVHTSMRVQDSLELGVSYFMAGLVRLKRIVDAAREARADGRPVLYLLDEVLQGTNSAERLIAVRTILSRLVRDGAIGAVTTHDLALAAVPEIARLATLVHFTERVDEESGELKMSFDYRLRPGLATSRNALKLMRLVGIDEIGIRQDAGG